MKKFRKDLSEGYRPSVEDAEWFLQYWQDDPKISGHEEALNKLFTDLCPRNEDLSDIIIKCSALNDFYSTNIFDVYVVADHILHLNIDQRLAAGDRSLVDDIADVRINGKNYTYYSFATKYCSHHQPQLYAIYDSYVDKVLVSLRDRYHDFPTFRKEDLRNYPKFMRVIENFSEYFSLNYSIKEIDQYLWQLGKWYFNPYGMTYKYYNRESKSPFPIDDIRSQFWEGEKMFVTNHIRVGEWREKGKEWLKTANPQIQQLAQKYTPEQFGMIMYICLLHAKWHPYDDDSWILDY